MRYRPCADEYSMQNDVCCVLTGKLFNGRQLISYRVSFPSIGMFFTHHLFGNVVFVACIDYIYRYVPGTYNINCSTLMYRPTRMLLFFPYPNRSSLSPFPAACCQVEAHVELNVCRAGVRLPGFQQASDAEERLARREGCRGRYDKCAHNVPHRPYDREHDRWKLWRLETSV